MSKAATAPAPASRIEERNGHTWRVQTWGYAIRLCAIGQADSCSCAKPMTWQRVEERLKDSWQNSPNQPDRREAIKVAIRLGAQLNDAPETYTPARKLSSGPQPVAEIANGIFVRTGTGSGRRKRK
jgi:hypothetical protein